MQNIKLIVGLGNPGEKYTNTRHNAGVDFVNLLCENFNIKLSENSKFFGLTNSLMLNNEKLHLLFPTTFMNRSGNAVQAMCRFYDIKPEEILVVHDEIDLPNAVCKLKFAGGHAGHNGLRDIIAALDSKDFYRLRLGVSRPENKAEVANFVLKKSSKEDFNLLQNKMQQIINLYLNEIINGDINLAIQQINSL